MGRVFKLLGSYGYLPFYYAHDHDFRAFVDAMSEPSGVNLINSMRVDALISAIAQGRLEPELSKLAAADHAFLANATASRGFWSHAHGHLSPEQLVDLTLVVGTSSSANLLVGLDPQIRVEPGDSLSKLAQQHLGDIGRWTDIYQLNRKAIGENPDHLQVGLMLKLPDS